MDIRFEIQRPGETREAIFDGSDFHRGENCNLYTYNGTRKEFADWVKTGKGAMTIYEIRREARVFIRCNGEEDFAELWP